MSNVIYYFTGTGNSLAVAKSLAKDLGDSILININEKQTEFNASGYERVGFVFPVYYYYLPIIVENFIKQMTFGHNQYIFAVVTYGGMRGDALGSLRKLLSENRADLNAEFSVFMPGNYIIEYGAIPEPINNLIISISKKTVSKISIVINQKQITKPARLRIFEKAYLGRKKSRKNIEVIRNSFSMMDKGFSVNKSCNGCGICKKICPAGNIELFDGQPQWQHKCEQCMACIQWCSKKSIDYLGKTKDRKTYHHPEITVGEMLNI